LKFTPEGGRVEVLARDTGVGIAREDQEAVFEEFRQLGTAEKKAEGMKLDELRHKVSLNPVGESG
jgi:signal transduction histidine kinase